MSAPVTLGLGEIIAQILEATGARAVADWLSILTSPITRSRVGGVVLERVLGISETMAYSSKIAGRSIREVIDIFFATEGPWLDFLAAYMGQLGVPIEDLSRLKQTGWVEGGAGFMQGLGKAFLSPLLNLILPAESIDFSRGGIKPEAGIAAAERYLAANLKFQMDAWYLHLVSDTVSLGMFKSIKDLPNAISWSYGLGWLSWLVMGVPFRLTISEPMERYYNKVLRPASYTRKQVFDLYNAGLIESDETYRLLSELGFSTDKISNLMYLESEKPNLSQVRQLVDRGHWNLEDVKRFFKNQGLWNPLRDSLAVMVYNTRAHGLLEQLLSQIDRAYIAGKYTGGELKQAYNMADYRSDEIALILERLDLQRELKEPDEPYERRLTPANIGRLYQLGHYGLSQATTRLLDVGFAGLEIGDFLLLYPPKIAKVEEPVELSVSTLGRMYKLRVIGRSEYENELREREVTAVDIARLELLNRPAEPKAPEPIPPRELSLAMVGRLYQQGFKPREWAVNHLERLNIQADDITTLLETVYKPLPIEEAEPKRLPVSVLGNLWRRSIINDQELRGYLLELGYTARDADYYILYFTEEPLPAPEPVPPTELSLSTVGRLHAGQYITTGEAVERLENIAIRAEDARLLLETLYQPPEPEVPGSRQLSTSQVGSMFKRGILSTEESRELLRDWRWSEVDIDRLLDYHERPPEIVEPLPKPRELTVSYTGRLYQRGAMTYTQAVERLMLVEYTESDSRLLLDYIFMPLEPEIIEPLRLSTSQVGQLYQTGIIDYTIANPLLEDIGWLQEERILILTLYQPPPEVVAPPVVPRALTPAIVGRLYREGTIRLIEAVDRLREVPYIDRDIMLFLVLYTSDTIMLETVMLYREETISLEQATRTLLELDYSREEINLILMYIYS